MTKLYANISIEHENNIDTITKRIVSAAQCNADAVIITKTTPGLVIPEEKKYVPITSRWGTLSYIDYAKKCEITKDTFTYVNELCNKIGIPLIWAVTDVTSAEFVKNYSKNSIVKIHANGIELNDLAVYCSNNFDHVIYPHMLEDYIVTRYKTKKEKNRYSIFYTVLDEQILLQNLNLNTLDGLKQRHELVGYESRTNSIFPCIATAYKNIDFIEKYLGDDAINKESVLNPEQLYDMHQNLLILEEAHG